MAEIKKSTRRAARSNVKENHRFEDEEKPLTVSPGFTALPQLDVKKTRQPLTPIQKSLKRDNDMVKVKKTVDANGNQGPSKPSNLTQIDKKGKSIKPKSKVGDNVLRNEGKPQSSKTPESKQKPLGATKTKEKVTESNKKLFSNKQVQTEDADIDLVTGATAPVRYFEELAETRRQALEETMLENETLVIEIDELKEKLKNLQGHNDMLLQCVDAEKLQEYYDHLSEISNSVAGTRSVSEAGDDEGIL